MMLHNNGELEERKVFSLQNCTFFCKSHLHECTLIVSWEKVSKHILYGNINNVLQQYSKIVTHCREEGM